VFVVYQGHHGDSGALRADVILPSNLWLEQNGTYVNIEGRLQRSYKAVPSVGESKESWKIIRKFAEYVNIDLQAETLEDVRIKSLKLTLDLMLSLLLQNLKMIILLSIALAAR
jgi:NADH-quinone oxidoreductase subunit G